MTTYTVQVWGGIMALVMIVAGVLFGFDLGTWFSVAMIAFAGGCILYDTSNVLHHYPEDRYVAAALELFASVALMLGTCSGYSFRGANGSRHLSLNPAFPRRVFCSGALEC